MNPLWLIVGGPVLLVCGVVLGAVLVGMEKRAMVRTARRLVAERAGDTRDSFADEMARLGVPRDVSVPLYAELARVHWGLGIHAFPGRADDDLRAVYGIALPDADNDFMDTDLRDVASGAAEHGGRQVTAAGRDLDAQLATLRTVRDLGRWLASLPASSAAARG